MSDTIGADAATKTNRRRTYAADGSMTEIFTMDSSKETGFLATYTLGQTLGSFRLATIESTVDKGRCRITLNWVSESAYTIRYSGTGVQRMADSTVQSIPIEEHPQFSGFASDGVPIVGGVGKPGVTSFLVPTPTYTRTTTASAFTFSEANIVENVGERNTPTGMTSPTANRWLKTGKTPSEEGDVVRITETWAYNPYGWDTDIYPPFS